MTRHIDDLTPLGRHVRAYRTFHRYSLAQFAEVSGLSKVALYEIETKARPNPRLDTLVAIARGTKTALSRIANLAAQSRGAIHEPR